MTFKRNVLTKILSNGMRADFALVFDSGIFKALLYVDGRPVTGPSFPSRLTAGKGEITHWMGYKTTVGLTDDEAGQIVYAVKTENSVLDHRARL